MDSEVRKALEILKRSVGASFKEPRFADCVRL